jgi:F-box domain
MANFTSHHWPGRRLVHVRAKILPRRDLISILGIPNELLLLIFNNLETVDQACLALSCWTLYHKIGPLVLDHPDLSSLLPAGDWRLIYPPRTEFLRRLEKDHHKRWLYCVVCRTLYIHLLNLLITTFTQVENAC